MKQNAKRILLWLSPKTSDQQPYFSSYEQLSLAVPDLSASGTRSIIKRLADQNLVRVERLGSTVTLSLTEHGRDALTSHFPALSAARRSWKGEWSCLVFREAPHSDPQFRYLRSLCLQHGSFSLARAVYLFPGQVLPEPLLLSLRELYREAAYSFELARWQFGDERTVITAQYALVDIAEVYSGVSKEIDQLLSAFDAEKGLTDTQKITASSVFDRLATAIQADPGLVHYYFPQVNTPWSLLDQLRSLVTRLVAESVD